MDRNKKDGSRTGELMTLLGRLRKPGPAGNGFYSRLCDWFLSAASIIREV
jgi:hypothetical protein